VTFGVGGPWVPIGRLRVLPGLWGGRGRWRKVIAARNWAIIVVRRDDSIDPDEGREPGE